MKVLIIAFTNLATDPRVIRQIDFFEQAGADVTTMACGAPGHDVEHIAVPFQITDWTPNPLSKVRLVLRQYDSLYWDRSAVKGFYDAVCGRQFDLIVANDIETLPLACRLSELSSARLWCDAHEYAPRQFEGFWKWRLLHAPKQEYYCRTYLPRVDVMTTVCNSIADEYTKNFKVACEVVTNAPYYQGLDPTPVKEGRIRMIYHGMAAASRGIDEVLDTMVLLDRRFQLDMILVPGDRDYIRRITAKVDRLENIRIIPPVPTAEIPRLCNRYDIGFFPLQPVSFNSRYALPNKFFEFIQARVCPAIYPLPEMATICRQYGCGIVSDAFTPESMASVLNSLSLDQLRNLKAATGRPARVHCAEGNHQIIQSMLTKVGVLPPGGLRSCHETV